jgi:hypothetical protein
MNNHGKDYTCVLRGGYDLGATRAGPIEAMGKGEPITSVWLDTMPGFKNLSSVPLRMEFDPAMIYTRRGGPPDFFYMEDF